MAPAPDRGKHSDMRSALLSPARADVRVLEADPDLAAPLPPDQVPIATRRVSAQAVALEAGPWEPSRAKGTCLGLLVLDGLISRTVRIAERSSTELLGSGDLLRPWQGQAEGGLVPAGVEWRVLERTRVAVLDERFIASAAPWPAITAELFGRAVQRSRWQSVFATISHMTRVEARLLYAFWHFADRWGRVTPHGVVIRLPLTHEAIGTLIGARRPTVTTALSALAERGVLTPVLRGEWLLTGEASARLDALRAEFERAAAA